MDDWGLCKNDYMWNHSTPDYECNKVCKIELLFWKMSIGKLVLECENEISNTAETLLNDKK